MPMNSNLGLDVGQANEFKLAFRRSDWDNRLIKELCEGDNLKRMLDVLRGDAEIVPVNRTVNLSADPVLDDGHQVVKHLKQGKSVPLHKIRLSCIYPAGLDYDPDVLCLNRRTLRPHFLKGQKPANICMRDFFIENSHHMPNRWVSGLPILFWGTICRSPNGLYVPGILGGRKYDRRISLDDWSRHVEYSQDCAVLAPALKLFY